MRQTEIFPYLEDQKLINEYIDSQKALDSWKKIKLISEMNAKRAKEILKDFNHSKKRSEFEMKKFSKFVEDCENDFSRSVQYVDIFQHLVSSYGTYFSSTDD